MELIVYIGAAIALIICSLIALSLLFNHILKEKHSETTDEIKWFKKERLKQELEYLAHRESELSKRKGPPYKCGGVIGYRINKKHKEYKK